MATRKGVVKKTELQEFSNPRRKGIWALDIDEGDELIAARLVKPEAASDAIHPQWHGSTL